MYKRGNEETHSQVTFQALSNVRFLLLSDPVIIADHVETIVRFLIGGTNASGCDP